MVGWGGEALAKFTPRSIIYMNMKMREASEQTTSVGEHGLPEVSHDISQGCTKQKSRQSERTKSTEARQEKKPKRAPAASRPSQAGRARRTGAAEADKSSQIELHRKQKPRRHSETEHAKRTNLRLQPRRSTEALCIHTAYKKKFVCLFVIFSPCSQPKSWKGSHSLQHDTISKLEKKREWQMYHIYGE